MTEPTRLTEAELKRLMAEANFPGAWGLFRQTEVRALVEEVRQLRDGLDSIIAELRDEPGDDDRLARTLSLAKALEARDAS